MKVVYNALENYEHVEQEIRSLQFDGVVNPVDGVHYPGIATIPATVARDINRIIRRVYPHTTVDVQFQFARLSLEGDIAPHKVHNDLSMGDYTCLLYLCGEGFTDICTHKELGFGGQPETDEQLKAWERDHSVDKKWHVDLRIPASRNKLVIYPASWMHRASTGYGYDHTDGRLVIVTFFNLRAQKSPAI